LSLIFIIARPCFDQRLFFVTTPRHDSIGATVVSEMHRRWLLSLRDAPPLPSYLLSPVACLLQSARRRLD
jgi:hypothetical protein